MITYDDLIRWKEDSIEVASKLKLLDRSVLDDLKNAKLTLNTGPRPKGICYGYAYYGPREIEVYSQNPSTEGLSSMQSLLEEDGMPESQIESLINAKNGSSDEKVFEVFNQSGMDHELIGHLGNYLSNSRCDDTVASVAQKEMVGYRAKAEPVWNLAVALIPIFQKHHRDVDLDVYS